MNSSYILFRTTYIYVVCKGNGGKFKMKAAVLAPVLLLASLLVSCSEEGPKGTLTPEESSQDISSSSQGDESSSSELVLSGSSVEDESSSSSSSSDLSLDKGNFGVSMGEDVSSSAEASSSSENVSSSDEAESSRSEEPQSSAAESSSSEASSSSVYVKVCGPEPNSVSAEEVFENQNKASFPDTSEYQVKIYVNSGNVIDMEFGMAVVTAGPTKSVTTIKNSLVQTETVRNDGRIKIIDLKTGKRLPADEAETNFLDFKSMIGTAEDYLEPVLEDGLWKLNPVDAAGKTLYYSACEERVTKIFYVSGDSTVSMTYSYFDDTADFPGVINGLHMDRSVYLNEAKMREAMGGDSIKVLMDWNVIKLKQRYALPMKMFDVD